MEGFMERDTLLRTALWANALFSGACGLTLLVVPTAVGAWIGLGGAVGFLSSLGAGLLAFAAGLAYLATRPVPPVRWVRAATLSDFLWVGATLVILLGPWTREFSERGLWTLVVVAQFVLLWGILQAIALWIVGRPTTGAWS
jgi:hypothetical protein